MQRRLRRLTGRTGPVTLGRHGGDQLGAGQRLTARAQDPRCRIQRAELGGALSWDGRGCLGWVAGRGRACRRALPRRGGLAGLLRCALGRGLLLNGHDASPLYKTGNRAVRLPRCPIRVSTVTSSAAPVQGNSAENAAFPAGSAWPPTTPPSDGRPAAALGRLFEQAAEARIAQLSAGRPAVNLH